MVRRGFGLVGEGGSPSLDLGDDVVGGFVPDEGLGVVVPVLGPELDGVDELIEAGEAAAAEASIGQGFEPALDEVQPGRAGRREVQVQRARLG